MSASDVVWVGKVTNRQSARDVSTVRFSIAKESTTNSGGGIGKMRRAGFSRERFGERGLARKKNCGRLLSELVEVANEVRLIVVCRYAGDISEIDDSIRDVVRRNINKRPRASGLKTNPQQLNRAARRNQNRSRHLTDEKITRLQSSLVLEVLLKAIAEVEDQLDTTIRQNSFSRRRIDGSIAFECPETLDKPAQPRRWFDLAITHAGFRVNRRPGSREMAGCKSATPRRRPCKAISRTGNDSRTGPDP